MKDRTQPKRLATAMRDPTATSSSFRHSNKSFSDRVEKFRGALKGAAPRLLKDLCEELLIKYVFAFAWIFCCSLAASSHLGWLVFVWVGRSRDAEEASIAPSWLQLLTAAPFATTKRMRVRANINYAVHDIPAYIWCNAKTTANGLSNVARRLITAMQHYHTVYFPKKRVI